MEEQQVASRVSGGAGHVVVLAIAVAISVSSLPDSAPRRALEPVVRPFLQSVGLQQRWPVFAPDPRRVVLDMYARIDYADQTHGIWTLPEDDRALGAYRSYRWRKLLENAAAGQEAVPLWRSLTEWIARTQGDPARPVVGVSLFRRWYPLMRPGEGGQKPTWTEQELYSLQLRPN